MTYFGFLAIFLGLPLLAAIVLTVSDLRRGRGLPPAYSSGSPWTVVLIHVGLALVYTTPWDNYLVATGVWSYDPALVTGLRLGWVPVEEYTFFIVQTLLSGLWLLILARRLRLPPAGSQPGWQPLSWPAAILAVLWLGAAGLLASGWKPGTYLGLILVWALPPILLQLIFGGDLLWRRRRLVALALLTVTLYLSAADSQAIGSGTWAIAPGQSLNFLLGGVLPFEELVFFLVTNTLIVFGVTLMLAPEGRDRFHWILARLKAGRQYRLTE